MQPQNPNPMQQGQFPQSVPPQSPGPAPFSGQPQQFIEPSVPVAAAPTQWQPATPAPMMLAPEPWQPPATPTGPAPQFQQPTQPQSPAQFTPMQPPASISSPIPAPAPPVNVQPPMQPQPMYQQAVPQQFPSASVMPPGVLPFQTSAVPPQPYQPPAPEPQPPVVQQFEMQIPHDDQLSPQPPMQPTQTPQTAVSTEPWQPPATPTGPAPQFQQPMMQPQLPISAPAVGQPQQPPPAPITPWQPQPAPEPAVTQTPEPQMSVQPPPEATVPRPEPVSDEVSRHHELNLQPLGSRKKEVTPIAEAIPPAAAASPNRWFQPTAAIPPATPVANQASQPLFPSDTPLKSFSQQQEARNRRHGMIVAAILIAALLVFGGSVLVYTVLNTRKTNDPKAVFNSMLSKNLATKQLHQSVVESKTGTTVQADYDVSDVTKPRILATAHTGGDANKVVTKYFSTFQNTFVQYQNTDGGTEAYLNKWVQVRNNGVLQPNSERTLASTFEARRIFFGQIVFGNFSSSDKKSLESAFKDNVFSYDKNKVKTETLGDDKTFIYEVKIDADKLVAYNQKVARMVGINPDEVNKESLQSVTSAMLYVDAATQRLLRLVTSDATINYSNYNSVAIQPQPASQMSWSDFLAANDPSGSTSGTASTSDADTTTSSGGTSSGAGSDGTPDQSSGSSDANFDDPNFDDPLWDGDAGEN